MKTSENGFSAVVSFDDLQEKLRTMSSGTHQWMAKLVRVQRREEGLTRIYAEIWYTNPTLADMPNAICYRFPVLRQAFWREVQSFVCLHPSLGIAVQEGLYFEGEELLNDCLEDFYSFWPPIRNALS